VKFGVVALAFLTFLPPAVGPPAPTGLSRVAVIRLTGELTPAHAALVRRAAREIRREPPAFAIVEIDSPGGRAEVMLDLGEKVMSLGVPTAAYIRPIEGGAGALSAAAYVALSCGRIFMSPGTVMGAAAPVLPTGEMLPEKHVSAFREKFRARAEQNGYPGALAAAMVDKDLEIFEATVDGRSRYLTKPELDQLRGQGVTFDREPVLFKPAGKLLTLTDRQAAAVGIAREAQSREDVYRSLGLASTTERIVDPTWSERLAGFLTRGVVTTVLLVAGLLGFWLEFKSPGVSLPGILGAIAFLLLFFGSHLAGLAEIPEILLFVAGLALIAVEVFLLPGVGVFALAGIVCAVAGLILSLQTFGWPDPDKPWQAGILLESIGRVLVSLVAAGGLAFVSLRFLPRVPVLGRLVLQSSLTDAASPAPPRTDLPRAGLRGRAVTVLRPAGKVEVDGAVFDAVSEGEFVAPGEPVEVVRIEASHLVVSKLKR
jgi:membrane-bound serine protease (ClpP class)